MMVAGGFVGENTALLILLAEIDLTNLNLSDTFDTQLKEQFEPAVYFGGHTRALGQSQYSRLRSASTLVLSSPQSSNELGGNHHCHDHPTSG
jgi:hypothetical protein